MPRLSAKQKRLKQARELIENEFLAEILEEQKEGLRDRWQDSRSPAERDECWYEITALEGLRDAIYAAARDSSG